MNMAEKATKVAARMNRRKPFMIDVKRFQIPGLKFDITCPHCGVEQTYDPDYFSYPEANGVEQVSLRCYLRGGGGCEKEFEFNVRIGISVTVINEKASA